MSLSAVSSPTFEREVAPVLVAVGSAQLEEAAEAESHSERCRADWRRPGGYWACVRRAGHRGRHRMRAAAHAA